jgi:hypothetical protein
MLLQFGCGLLFGISITFLKDADRPFTDAINLDELIFAALFSPAEDSSAKFIPL